MSEDMSASEMLDLFAQRRALLARVLESEASTKQTLFDALEYSRSTVNKIIRELQDVHILDAGPNGLTPTLLTTLVWAEYRTFERRVGALRAELETDVERRAAMDLIADRPTILECLATPHDKRDLVARVDDSRSTVDRAVRELEMAGLVVWTEKGYTTPPPVQQATQQYHAVVDRVTDILGARDILKDISPDCPIETALLADATVTDTADAPPYHLPAGIQDRLATAERVRLCLPVLSTPLLLDTCQRQVIKEGVTLGLLTPPPLFETLTDELPGPLATMASAPTGSCTAHVTDTLPSFGLILTETGTKTTVSVLSYSDHQTIEGVIYNDTEAAIEWAEDCYTDACAGATERTDFLRDLEPAHHARASTHPIGNSSDRIDLETEGIVQLTSEYFAQRAPAPPLTGWRAGFDLVDVHAGYALDREIERDGTRYSLTDELTERLRTGTNQAVLGDPGSGKSTVCKSVACRWYEQGLGPVFYRESGTGATVESPALLRKQLRTAASRGHVLVVIEDAVRAEANAAFGVMQAFRGNGNVTFLLDARESEWTDPEMLPADVRRDTYREDAIETVFVPTLDDPEVDRFVRQFTQTTAHALDSQTAHQLHEVEPVDDQPQDPGELLLLLHRLVLAADPLASYSTHTPTSLVEDVQRTYAMLDGPIALDVGVLVNLLNAAGMGVSPELVCSLAATEGEPTIEAVRKALSALEGRIIFDRNDSSSESTPYQTIHEAWSVQFLEHLLDVASEHAAHQRVGRCITALLALADEPERRDRIKAAFVGDTPAIDRIATEPTEWADATVEQLFELGLHRSGLAAVFGRTDESTITLPNVCSQAVTVECTQWRTQMALKAGDYDRAAHEYEMMDNLADEVAESDPVWAANLRVRRLGGLGTVAYYRNEYDTAKEYCTRGLDQYENSEADSPVRRASIWTTLGGIAMMRGDLKTARDYNLDCLETYRDLGRWRDEAMTLFNHGTIIEQTDGVMAAIEQYQQALDSAQEIGYRWVEVRCLARLGHHMTNRGHLETAEAYCTQALDLAREIGDSHHEARSLEYVGNISRVRGDLDTAAEYYQQSLDIFHELGDRQFKAQSLMMLGTLARERGDLDTATEHCMTSYKTYQDIDCPTDEAKSLTALGEIARKRGDLDTARERAQESLRLSQETSDGRSLASSHQLFGEISRDHGQFMTAETHLTQALHDYRDDGYRYEEAESLAALGDLARRRNEPADACEHFGEAVELYREIGAVRDTIEVTEDLAAVCVTMGDIETAHDHCETVHELAQATEFVDIPVSLEERHARLREKVGNDSD